MNFFRSSKQFELGYRKKNSPSLEENHSSLQYFTRQNSYRTGKLCNLSRVNMELDPGSVTEPTAHVREEQKAKRAWAFPKQSRGHDKLVKKEQMTFWPKCKSVCLAKSTTHPHCVKWRWQHFHAAFISVGRERSWSEPMGRWMKLNIE